MARLFASQADTAERRATFSRVSENAYAKAMAVLLPRYGTWHLFEHVMPFDVARAYDEAKDLDHPRLWTVERDHEVWTALEHDA